MELPTHEAVFEATAERMEAVRWQVSLADGYDRNRKARQRRVEAFELRNRTALDEDHLAKLGSDLFQINWRMCVRHFEGRDIETETFAAVEATANQALMWARLRFQDAIRSEWDWSRTDLAKIDQKTEGWRPAAHRARLVVLEVDKWSKGLLQKVTDRECVF